MNGIAWKGTKSMSSRTDAKSVLVIGGAQQHCKLVEAVRRVGAESIVVDYLEDSPAKSIADKSYNADVKDLDSLVRICEREAVDGVVAGWLDPCQLPYFHLCKKLGVPCYGSEEAFRVMTDKERFKSRCGQWSVGTIPYLCGSRDEIVAALGPSALRYPLFVKPVDSRGSRGQAICENESELLAALNVAERESSNRKVLVEKDMTGADDISVTYFFVDGEAYLERISDRILGSASDHLSNVCVGTISPSKHYSRYMEEAHESVVKMLRALGIENGPAFMQGFVDDEGFYFYDPGLRFPGGDYERAVKEATGFDFAEELVRFSLGERMRPPTSDIALLGGMVEVIHDVCVAPGIIESLSGVEEVGRMPGVVSANLRYGVGDLIGSAADVGRRLAEINFLASGYAEALERSRAIQAVLSVRGENGDMKVSSFVRGFEDWVSSSRSEQNR